MSEAGMMMVGSRESTIGGQRGREASVDSESMMCSDECRKELQLSNLGLEHETPRRFLEPECGGTWMAYVLYRLVAALYFLTVLCYDIGHDPQDGKWFIYLTNWSLTLLTFTLVYEFILVTQHYVKANNLLRDERVYPSMPLRVKILWVLNNIVTVSAPIITLVFWGSFGTDEKLEINFKNINAHAFNFVYVLVNVFVTGMPVRLFHFTHTILYGTLYVIFSVCYWRAGGTNLDDKPYIYRVVDYGGNPELAVVWCVSQYLGVCPVLHATVYGVYRLRMMLYRTSVCHTLKDYLPVARKDHNGLKQGPPTECGRECENV